MVKFFKGNEIDRDKIQKIKGIAKKVIHQKFLMNTFKI